jgi:hypothetical protein
VRLLEAGESAGAFRFADLFRYVAAEGTRQSQWLSFDETRIAEALAAGGDEETDAEDEVPVPSAAPRPRKRTAKTGAADTAVAGRRSTAVAATPRSAAGAAQRARMNQRAFYQAFSAFERYRLIRRLGIDERQRPEEQFRLDERDFGGIYEFTDLIDRFLPPAGLVQHDELRPTEESAR